jgi:hypothetical protein
MDYVFENGENLDVLPSFFSSPMGYFCSTAVRAFFPYIYFGDDDTYLWD